MSTKKANILKNQRGLASILVTMILMIIISLIVIGLARLSRREQRQALDDQLSTQAFYAAESGVNDAIKLVNAHTPLLPSYATQCKNSGSFITDKSLANTLDAANSVSYTCVLVDNAPKDIQYPVSTDTSTIAPIIAHDDNGFGRNIESLQFSWQDKDAVKNASGCNPATSMTFPPNTGWPANCSMGIIRVDVMGAAIDGNNGGGNDFHRSTIASNTHTFFLYPVSSGGLTTLSWVPNGHEGMTVPVQCNGTPGPLQCTVLMDHIMPGINNYMVRMRSIYHESSVSITGYYRGIQTRLEGQTVIDATGKANDVLRRIQVRIPQATSYYVPEFSIQTGDILCKRLLITPGANTAATDNGSTACDPFH